MVHATYRLQFVSRNSSKPCVKRQMFTRCQFIDESVELGTISHALMDLLHLGHNTVVKEKTNVD